MSALKKVTINQDLLRERKKCTFDPEELTNFLDGGKEKTGERRSRGRSLFIASIQNNKRNVNMMLTT